MREGENKSRVSGGLPAQQGTLLGAQFQDPEITTETPRYPHKGHPSSWALSFPVSIQGKSLQTGGLDRIGVFEELRKKRKASWLWKHEERGNMVMATLKNGSKSGFPEGI